MPFTAGFTVTLFDDGGNQVGQQVVAASTNMEQMDFNDDVRIVEITTAGLTAARLVFGLATG